MLIGEHSKRLVNKFEVEAGHLDEHVPIAKRRAFVDEFHRIDDVLEHVRHKNQIEFLIVRREELIEHAVKHVDAVKFFGKRTVLRRRFDAEPPLVGVEAQIISRRRSDLEYAVITAQPPTPCLGSELLIDEMFLTEAARFIVGGLVENVVVGVKLVLGKILVAILKLLGRERILLEDESALVADCNVHAPRLDAAADQIAKRQNFFRLDRPAADAALINHFSRHKIILSSDSASR